MVNILIQRCGFLFWPQVILNIAVITLIVSYFVALKRGEVCSGQRPWTDTLEPLAGLAPMIGMTGSVWGFVQAFANFQRGVDVSALANGLSMAFFTTLAGLVTAIIATLGSYILSAINK